MPTPRNTYKYHFKVRNKIVHSGITDDLERRDGEHQQKWPNGHIKQVGYRTTEEAAREWEETQKKARPSVKMGPCENVDGWMSVRS